MDAAARKGIPEVVVPGAVEAFNFGAPETIPECYNTSERKVILHNPNITSLLATPEEMVWLGEYVANHVNANPAPKAIYLPLLGLDRYMAEGGPWFGPEYLTPLFDAIRNNLNSDNGEASVTEMENHINDEEFAVAVAEKFLEIYQISLDSRK